MATRANQQEFEDARRRLTAAVSADQSLDYVGDSGIVALSTTRGARSGEVSFQEGDDHRYQFVDFIVLDDNISG